MDVDGAASLEGEEASVQGIGEVGRRGGDCMPEAPCKIAARAMWLQIVDAGDALLQVDTGIRPEAWTETSHQPKPVHGFWLCTWEPG